MSGLRVCCLPAWRRLRVQALPLHLASALSFPAARPTLPTSQVQEKEDTYKQTRIDALFGAARVKRQGRRARVVVPGCCSVRQLTVGCVTRCSASPPTHPRTSPSAGHSWRWRAVSSSNSRGQGR